MTLLTLLGQTEFHAAGRAGWLRAAVLGANDGLVSTASLMVGAGGGPWLERPAGAVLWARVAPGCAEAAHAAVATATATSIAGTPR